MGRDDRARRGDRGTGNKSTRSPREDPSKWLQPDGMRGDRAGIHGPAAGSGMVYDLPRSPGGPARRRRDGCLSWTRRTSRAGRKRVVTCVFEAVARPGRHHDRTAHRTGTAREEVTAQAVDVPPESTKRPRGRGSPPAGQHGVVRRTIERPFSFHARASVSGSSVARTGERRRSSAGLQSEKCRTSCSHLVLRRRTPPGPAVLPHPAAHTSRPRDRGGRLVSPRSPRRPFSI